MLSDYISELRRDMLNAVLELDLKCNCWITSIDARQKVFNLSMIVSPTDIKNNGRKTISCQRIFLTYYFEKS